GRSRSTSGWAWGTGARDGARRRRPVRRSSTIQRSTWLNGAGPEPSRFLNRSVSVMRWQANVRPSMRIWKGVKLCAVTALAVGCQRPPTVPVDAGAPVAVVVDAGPRVPLALDLLIDLPDGGSERHALLGLETPA